MRLAYGIVPVDNALTVDLATTEKDRKLISNQSMLKYLAQRQLTPVPFLPIRGEKERKLAHRKLNEYLVSSQSIGNQTTFEKLCTEWNMTQISISNNVYPKMPYHFAKYVKSWRKNQDRRDAEVASGSHLLSEALTYVPTAPSRPNFPTVPLNGAITENNSDPIVDNTILDRTHSLQRLCANVKREPRKRRCKMKVNDIDCPNPYTCPGRIYWRNCFLITGGDPNKRTKRKSPVNNGPMKCFVCKQNGCPGVSKRKFCPNYTGNHNT